MSTERIPLPQSRVSASDIYTQRTRDGRTAFCCYETWATDHTILGHVGGSHHEVQAALEEYRQRVRVHEALTGNGPWTWLTQVQIGVDLASPAGLVVVVEGATLE